MIAWMRQLSCRIVTYIDDNLIMASTEEQVPFLADIVVALLEELGFARSPSSSHGKSYSFWALLSIQKNDNLNATRKAAENSDVGAKEVLKATSIKGREIASLVGTASSMALGIPPACSYSTGRYNKQKMLS